MIGREKDLQQYITAWKNITGDFRSIDLKGQSFYSGTGGTCVTLNYLIHGSKREEQAQLQMTNEGNSLRVLSCNFNGASSTGPGPGSQGLK